MLLAILTTSSSSVTEEAYLSINYFLPGPPMFGGLKARSTLKRGASQRAESLKIRSNLMRGVSQSMEPLKARRPLKRGPRLFVAPYKVRGTPKRGASSSYCMQLWPSGCTYCALSASCYSLRMNIYYIWINTTTILTNLIHRRLLCILLEA